ncbi:trna-splicing endonuclease subunit sen2 [Moniliophthora roreri]|nr:trna-splicing endonuclease subunit sen2 [Moniliophthora roreri]
MRRKVADRERVKGGRRVERARIAHCLNKSEETWAEPQPTSDFIQVLLEWVPESVPAVSVVPERRKQYRRRQVDVVVIVGNSLRCLPVASSDESHHHNRFCWLHQPCRTASSCARGSY